MAYPVSCSPLSPREVAPLTRRILATYRGASLEELTTGAAWYGHAHRIASSIAQDTGYSTRQVAGVIAALSPQNGWEQNVPAARTACERGTAARLHTGCQVRKADAILAGAEPLDVLKGNKERSFFGNIVDPTDPSHVTIDRHAHDVAVGRRFGVADRGLGSRYRYANLALAYRRAAAILGVSPSTVQAVVWQAWTDRSTLLDTPYVVADDDAAAWEADSGGIWGLEARATP